MYAKSYKHDWTLCSITTIVICFILSVHILMARGYHRIMSEGSQVMKFLEDSLYDTIVFILYAINIIGLFVILFATVSGFIPWYLGLVFLFIGIWCLNFLIRTL